MNFLTYIYFHKIFSTTRESSTLPFSFQCFGWSQGDLGCSGSCGEGGEMVKWEEGKAAGRVGEGWPLLTEQITSLTLHIIVKSWILEANNFKKLSLERPCTSINNLLVFVSQKLILFWDHCNTDDCFNSLYWGQRCETPHHNKHQHQNHGYLFLDSNSISLKKEKTTIIYLLNATKPQPVWLNIIK